MKITLFLILSIIFIISAYACYYLHKAIIRTKGLKKEQHDLLEQISELRETARNEQTLSQLARDNYCKQLDDYLTAAEQKFDDQMLELDNNYSKKVQEYDDLIQKKSDQLSQVKNILVLAAQQALAEKEKKDQELVYRLSLTEQDINDIQILNQIKSKVSQPTVLSKLIWTTYIQKPTNALCLRLTKGKTVTGIYKITNLLTSQVYIGQSVDISSRIKQHIKAGLGINCTSLNKLYSSMQSDGVYNFKYEILEECPSSALNELEKKWIDIFQSNVYGLNSNAGVSK